MNAFLLTSAAVISSIMSYGLMAAPWWLRIALVIVGLWFGLLFILAYVSRPPLTGGERSDNS